MHEVFKPANLGGITVNNRIIRSATHEGFNDETGRPTEALIKKYEQLARGGVGAIITGYVGIMKNGKSPAYHMGMLDSDENLDAFTAMVKRVHELKTPIIVQIAHCGRQTRSKITGYPTVAPSAIRDGMYNEDMPHELTETEIFEIIDHFTDSMVRGKKAGFDGVQLHLAHGYLLSSFLSPHMNKRRDQWGGNTENRFRIVKEILARSKEVLGNYPILAKINANEKSADGMNQDEAVKIAKLLEENGCSGIEVSCGIVEDGFWFARGEFPFEIIAKENFRMAGVPRFMYPLMKWILKSQSKSPKPYFLYNLESAMGIRAAVNIPVIVVGGIRKLSDIRQIIENEQCDFVSMARPFIIEPDLVRKFQDGKQAESRCINCNYCVIGIDARPFKCYYGKINQ